ncbi:hypothetical protein J6590_092248 [Homalodisca vitripennis]|nr:hypothetical protein J6590_092248 [Homalodisca vitripennis]
MTVVVNDESKHSTFSRINIVICFIPCGGPTVICFIPCGSRAADPLDGHRNADTVRFDFASNPSATSSSQPYEVESVQLELLAVIGTRVKAVQLTLRALCESLPNDYKNECCTLFLDTTARKLYIGGFVRKNYAHDLRDCSSTIDQLTWGGLRRLRYSLCSLVGGSNLTYLRSTETFAALEKDTYLRRGTAHWEIPVPTWLNLLKLVRVDLPTTLSGAICVKH